MTDRLLAAAMELGFKSENEAKAWLSAWMDRHNLALGCKPAERPEDAERLLRMIGAGVYA